MNMKLFEKYSRLECGFTLIEMMVSMAMGLVIIAGLASVFTSMGKTSSTSSAKTERMGDLYLMSQIMQEELRFSLKCRQNALQSVCPTNPKPVNASAKGVLQNLDARINRVTALPGYPSTESVFDKLPYWDGASKSLTYQNQDGDVGIFHYQHNATKDAVFWLRADSNIHTFAELSRDLDVIDGMCALDANGGCLKGSMANATSIKLIARYLNENHQSKTMSLSFIAWPRN